MLVTLFCLYFGEKPAEKMDRGQHMSQRRGDFFYFEWKPNIMPGLGRLCKPITEGGGILIHSLTRVTSPPPPSMDAYGNLDWSVVANSVLRGNFVMSLRMAENLTSSVKMPFLRQQFLLSTKKGNPYYYCYISEIIIFITTKHYSEQFVQFVLK